MSWREIDWVAVGFLALFLAKLMHSIWLALYSYYKYRYVEFGERDLHDPWIVTEDAEVLPLSVAMFPYHSQRFYHGDDDITNISAVPPSGDHRAY